MGKDDIKNILSLTKKKLRISGNNMLKASAVIFFAYLALLLPNIMTTLKYKDVAVDIRLFDYSLYFFIGLVIAGIVMNITYKQTNDCFSVFPQTNTGRFISSEIIMYIWLVLISVIALVCYLLQILIFKSFSAANNNIILVFNIDYGFVLIGFFVFFMYGLLVLTFISLIAAIIRKFDTYAVIALLIIIALLFTGKSDINKAVSDWFGFLTRETRIGIFFIKGLITWLLLLISSVAINKFTVYYKTKKKYKNSIISAVGITAIIVVNLIRLSILPDDEPLIKINMDYSYMNNDVWIENSIIVDASDYEDLSDITIDSNIKDSDNFYFNSRYLPSSIGEKIIIKYRLPVRITNNYDLVEITNPELTATLKDNKLSIDYSYEKNIKVLFISPWFMMKQFERYQNKNLYSERPDFNNTNSYSNGYLNLYVE